MAKVLAIDDKQDNLITLSALFSSLFPDCTVITAQTGAEGIQKAQTELPDTILLDLKMPEMDGFEVCRRLKSNDITKHIPIIILTALKTDSQGRSKVLQLGAEAFLTKPFDGPELVAQVYTMLRIKKSEDLLRKEKDLLIKAVEKKTYDLLKRSDDLEERVKELNCLYGISDLIEKPNVSLEELLQGTADLIPPSWQYPEITCASIIIEDQEHITKNFRESAWKQVCKIVVHGERIGAVEVYYLEEKPEIDEGPFLKEERNLIKAIAERLGCVIERKQAEEELRESEYKYRMLLENVPQKIFHKDSNFVYVSCNENYARDLRIKPEEIIGKTDYEFFPKELAEKYRTDDKRIVTLGKTEEIEEKYIHDGQERVVQTVKTPVKDEKGNITGVLGIFWDITERRKMETERKNLELQLLQSEKMASVGQLAAGVAHEINNPVGFVSSNLKTLFEYIKDINDLTKEYRKLFADLKVNSNTEGVPDNVSGQVQRIKALEEEVDIAFILNDIFELIEESREGTERIKNIVQGLKDFAHPGEDKPKFADINKNLDSTVNVVQNELKYKADVIKDYGDLPQVHCYPQLINQVFVNILVNAAQSIENRGEISIKTRADNGYAEIKISDTGAGIPTENLSKIFDPFFTTKEVGKGTGLGMHVAYNIIKKHHGNIDVKSNVGKGTTFTIRIPVDNQMTDDE